MSRRCAQCGLPIQKVPNQQVWVHVKELGGPTTAKRKVNASHIASPISKGVMVITKERRES